MNSTKRTTAWGAMSCMAFAGCLLYAMSAAAVTDAECDDAWDDAPAEGYCTSGGETATTDGTKCAISVSSCSITVDIVYDQIVLASVAFTPTFPADWTNSSEGVSLADTDDIDICFDAADGADADGGNIVATVRTACGNNEINSSDAKRSGVNIPE